jgi:hypothetical protein
MTMRFIEHALELVLLGPSNHLMRREAEAAIREVSP